MIPCLDRSSGVLTMADRLQVVSDSVDGALEEKVNRLAGGLLNIIMQSKINFKMQTFKLSTESLYLVSSSSNLIDGSTLPHRSSS